MLLASVAALVVSVAAPQLEWRTIHSECCDIHYPKALEHTARRIANIADDSVNNASAFLQSQPQDRVQVVIHDVTDSPNGFTNVVPYDSIDLRMVTPESDSDLAVTDEYLRLLIQHEMLHIVHLDTIHGLPAVVNLVVGKVWPPNIIQPRFIVEGLATYTETRFTSGGRLRSAIFSSDLLIAALGGDLWQLDDLSNYSRRGPGGGAAYVYGAEFVSWLAKRYGPDIWAKIANDYGGSIIPFAVQRSIESATGHPVEPDYQLFLDDIRAEAERLRQASLARGGPTVRRRLTRFGASIHGPRFDADGTLYFGLDLPDGPPGVYAIRGLPDAVPVAEPVVRTNDAADVALVPRLDEDGRALPGRPTLVVTQTETTRGYYSFHDLWRLGDGADDTALHRVTREARVRAPSLVPGTRTVVAEQRTAEEAAIVAVDVDTGVTRDIVRAVDGTLYYTPDVSPDGRRVAVSRWLPGGERQIVEIDVATGSERWLTDDGAQNIDPAWTVDGRYVLFASDREGMFCIYAVDRETREVRRVVDSLGLAKAPRPTPDGKGVVYVDTGLDGNDLYAASLDLAHAAVVDAPAAPAPLVREATPESSAEPERYNAFFTLLPRYYIPLVSTDAAGGPSVGVAVVGDDAVGQLALSAQASWGFGLERPHLAASLHVDDSYLPMTVSSELRTDRSDSLRRTDGVPDVQQETVFSAGVSVQVPFLRARRFSHSLSFGYQRQFHVVENPLTSPPDARAPVYPPTRNIGALTLDWGYSGAESYRDSVGNERGFTSFLHLRHADKLTFSEQDITEAVVDARAFLPVPGLGGHTLGIYLSGGVAFGDRLVRTSFFLSGFQDRDITGDLISGNRSGAGFLRGYPQFAVGGDSFALATLEYRLPLLEVERGVATLPLYFDRVHAAFFTDLGNAFVGAPVATGMRASVGIELQAEVTLAYYGLFLVRAGYARGVSQDGIDQPYLVLGFPY